MRRNRPYLSGMAALAVASVAVVVPAVQADGRRGDPDPPGRIADLTSPSVEPAIWYVDDDNETAPWSGTSRDPFWLIQHAIDAAAPGDIVYVLAGHYREHLLIREAITLIGEDRSTTRIDGGGQGDVIRLLSGGVTISQLTVMNSGSLSVPPNIDVGIELITDGNVIRDVVITENRHGIYLHSSHNTITDNRIVNNHDDGILCPGGSYNLVLRNLFRRNKGIGFHIGGLSEFSPREGFTGNIVAENAFELTGNRGICKPILQGGNQFFHNSFRHNAQNACPYFTEDRWDSGYPSGGNYWDDYAGVDRFHGPHQNLPGPDGIGDTPHTICQHEDRYPLMEPHHVGSPAYW